MSSELSGYNKTIAHNTFVTAINTPTVGIIGWAIEKIYQLDIKTRITLTLTGNFHPNSDVDKLYMSQASGGRGSTLIKTLFESRIVSISQHLKLN